MEIKTPSTDKVLGDRTFYYAIGKRDNIIWTTTYSYATMTALGDTSLARTIPHKDRHY